MPRPLLRRRRGGHAPHPHRPGAPQAQRQAAEAAASACRWTRPPLSAPGGAAQEDLLALDEALRQLEAEEPVKARLVKLRFFAGASLEDAARMLGVSPATAKRYWVYARSWLYGKLHGQ